MKILHGIVVKGDGRGKKLGFPTANIQTKTALSSLYFGVYVSYVSIHGKKFPSVAHIGPVKIFRVMKPRLEVHILDWYQDIYGKEITIEIVKKIRNTKSFFKIEDLLEAMREDIKAARLYFTGKEIP